ncbi:MAG: winged helix-turn-helix transcriptional regulator [Deinococcus sp.]|nr:winged helix-turn-helix transcriptional regulator [Deinococcus sp.]
MRKAFSDQELAAMFQALGDAKRLEIFRLALAQGCYCGTVVEELELPQSTVSHHLAVLKHAGLVEAERQGRCICYKPTAPALRALQEVLRGFAEECCR